MSKEMKQKIEEANKYCQEKLNEILGTIEEKFGCAFSLRIIENFSNQFMANFILNYMHYHELDKTNKDHRAAMLARVIESTKSAAQLAFELCDDCMNNTSHTH